MVGKDAIAVIASSSGFSSRPRLRRGAAIRKASMGEALVDAASRRTSNGSAGERSPFRHVPCEPNALGRFRQAAMQEQVRHLLETGVRSQIFNGVPRDGQPARRAIDLAEPSRGGDDVFQSISHVVDIWEVGETCQY